MKTYHGVTCNTFVSEQHFAVQTKEINTWARTTIWISFRDFSVGKKKLKKKNQDYYYFVNETKNLQVVLCSYLSQ